MPTTLKSRILQIMASLQPQVEKAMREGAEEIAEKARERVPVESGELRNAIHVEDVAEGVSVIAGDEQVFYGHLVEFGTTRAPARPFLVPAYESSRDHINDMIKDALGRL